MTRVGVIDCGTNSCRLLVAETGADGRLSELTRELEIVRLGQGVDATGELHPDALARTFAAAERYADRLASFRVASDHVRVVATSAVRDATNPEVFFAGMAGSRLPIAVAHGEGRADFSRHGSPTDVVPAMRYLDGSGAPAETYPANPNG